MLITPEKFLSRTSSESPRTLAIRIYKKLQVELDTKAETSANYLEAFVPNFFSLAFVDAKAGDKVLREVENRVDAFLKNVATTEEPEFRILPPLFLLSNDKFIVKFDDLLLLGTQQGPIVPVVALKTIREKSAILEQLIFLYSLSDEEYMNVDNIRFKLLPQEEVEETNV
jgi:hypothetical protein